MIINFTKMQTLGNDFIFIENYNNILPQTDEELSKMIQYLANRKLGIGADQVVIISKVDFINSKDSINYQSLNSKHLNETKIQNKLSCRANIQIYNANGANVEACGNAFLCLGYYFENNKTSNCLSTNTTISTNGKPTLDNYRHFNTIELIVESTNKKYLVSLFESEKQSPPKYIVNMVKFDFSNNTTFKKLNSRDFISFGINLGSQNYQPIYVNIGNPHLILFSNSKIEAKQNIDKFGTILQKHSLFKNTSGVNIESVFIDKDATINMFVWERGVGKTLACGSGATAAFLAAFYYNLVKKTSTVRMEGGELTIKIESKSLEENNLYIIGSPRYVYNGIITI